MARVFITGSADGLGHLAANLLIRQGHQVVLHARNADRGRLALGKLPGAENVLTADLSKIEEIKKLAAEANALGSFDAIIHNAGVYNPSVQENPKDFQQTIITVNTLAPYILTCLIRKPKRLIYLSSGLHAQGDPGLKSLNNPASTGSNYQAYSDSKLHEVILCMAVARKWPDVYTNAVNPGWVPTKMGGRGAPDSLEKGFQTQVWLAVSNDDHAKTSGHYFYHQKQQQFHPAAGDINTQEKFLALCEGITGVHFPDGQK